MEAKKYIVIIGGGITGLSAAWELQNQAQDLIRYSVLEAGSVWGGKVVTARVPGPNGGEFIIDGGAESIVTRKPEAWDLAHELGLAGRVQDPGSETTDIFVLDGGAPVPIPLHPGAFIRSKLLTARGKLRLLAEPFIPAKHDAEDETLADFVSRRLGVEAMEKFIGPVLAGIYNTDPHQQSILTTSPIMREMEAEYGSLFKAVIRRMRKARAQSQRNTKRPRFITFKNGSGELIDTLVTQLQGDLRLDTPVARIERHGAGYRVFLVSDAYLDADSIILATPANMAARLLQPLDQDSAKLLGKIRHTGIGTIALFYKTGELEFARKINGLMIPRREKRKIDAVTFPIAKMPNRAPAGYSVVRVFFGGGAPELVNLDDIALVQTVRDELKQLLGVEAAPIDYVIFRWPESFPQADIGHLDRVEEIVCQLPEGLYIAGGSYRGIGVPDCVRQGRDTARQAFEKLLVT